MDRIRYARADVPGLAGHRAQAFGIKVEDMRRSWPVVRLPRPMPEKHEQKSQSDRFRCFRDIRHFLVPSFSLPRDDSLIGDFLNAGKTQNATLFARAVSFCGRPISFGGIQALRVAIEDVDANRPRLGFEPVGA